MRRLTKIDQKYPAPSPGFRSLIVAIGFGLFIGLFLLFFEPFDINLNSSENKVFHLLFYGLISTIILIISLYLLPLFLPTVFSDEHWTVKHQIVFLIATLFLIATANGLYTNYINSLHFTWTNYGWMISRTFVLGGIPIAFLTLLDFQRKVSSNTVEANDIQSVGREFAKESRKTIHHIYTDLKNEHFTFDEDEFTYAIAVGNYIDLYTIVDDKVEKKTFRLALSSFEKQLEEASNIIRCHRSYLVNMDKIIKVTGNAQGLKLELENQEKVLPVSRKYIPAVRSFFKKNQSF